MLRDIKLAYFNGCSFTQGGGLETDNVLDSAKRELLEEIGIKANNWKSILDIHLSNSVSDEKGVIYIAKELSYHNPEPEDCEVLQIKKLPFNQVYQMVSNFLTHPIP